MSKEQIHLLIDGDSVAAMPGTSVMQARMQADAAVTRNIGCMGQGVCGSCRCLIRRAGEREVRTALACETRVEAGLQVSFIDYFHPTQLHRYDLRRGDGGDDGWQRLEQVQRVFPEAAHCRHCGGCDRACPKGLAVQQGVAQALAGDFAAVAEVFDPCVMCNLCTLACPENIRPNHLGLFVRRERASQARPVDLLRRLHQIASGQMHVDSDAVPGASA